MLPHCGKCTNATGTVHATIIIPISVSPVAVLYLELVKNNNWVNPEPKLPPAPIIPEMIPSDLRDINGMIPKVAPHAACAPIENKIIERTERSRVLALPRHMQNIPPRVWRIYRFHKRPRIPNRRAFRSDNRPPSGRAIMFAMPNVAAIVPAV